MNPRESLLVRISGEFELPRNRLSRCNCTRELEAREHEHGKMGLLIFCGELSNSVFLMTTRAVCPNINPTMLCAHVCDVNYAVCYCIAMNKKDHS